MSTILDFILHLNREAFYIPFFDVPVYWYGILFGIGFYLTAQTAIYLIHSRFLPSKNLNRYHASLMVQSLTTYLIIAIVAGARLFHVAFYDGLDKLIDIKHLFAIREGGLASHGAIFFILVAFALWALRNKETLTAYGLHPFSIFDAVCHSSMIVSAFIRMGNFINQEILGKPTHSLFGVIFPNPAHGFTIEPRHPVVLYEAFFYLSFFVALFWIARWGIVKKIPGLLTGIFFIVLFTFRFTIEFFKENQSIYDGNILSMGELLSLPMLVFGILLTFGLIVKERKKNHQTSNG